MNDRKSLMFGFQTIDIQSAMTGVENPRALAVSLGGALYTIGTAIDLAGNATNLAVATGDRLATFSSANALLVTRQGDWGQGAVGGGGVRATTTRAASATGERHVCTSISAHMGVTVAIPAPGIQVVLRDGASGVGPILWTTEIVGQVLLPGRIFLSALNIVGSPDTAMTWEFVAAGPATSFQDVSFTGYTSGV